MKFLSRLAALVGVAAFLVTGLAIAPASAKTIVVHSYTRHTKSGKVIHVKSYVRHTGGKKIVKVHSFTRVTKNGKIIHVKAHSRTVTHVKKKSMSHMHM